MKTTSVLLLLLFTTTFFGQNDDTFNGFTEIYPFGEDPNIRYMTSYASQETILFEANPIMRYSIYNNFMSGFMESTPHTQAWYVAFKPQLRMYNSSSKPVKMPSYRIQLGTQHLFNIPCEDKHTAKFWGFSLESGHYSNGQNRSSFAEEFEDDSPEGNAVYATITPSTQLSKILNRNSGNFSTNLTELQGNYRKYKLDSDHVGIRMYSLTLGYTLYHNYFLGIGDFGGYTDNDIKIYGRNRYSLAGEFMNVIQTSKLKGIRYTAKQTFEYIDNPHQSVEKLRAETMLTVYPFKRSKTLGILASYIYGHDNYNYRFVDHGNQFSIGLTWCQFPPVQLTKAF